MENYVYGIQLKRGSQNEKRIFQNLEDLINFLDNENFLSHEPRTRRFRIARVSSIVPAETMLIGEAVIYCNEYEKVDRALKITK